jgi:hypothetical protein
MSHKLCDSATLEQRCAASTRTGQTLQISLVNKPPATLTEMLISIGLDIDQDIKLDTNLAGLSAS